MAVQGRDYYTGKDDTYYKSSLVEVIDIVIYDTVLGLNVSYKSKLFANNL